jgi:peptidoglycan/xylan/chitin deacetylase (PgdA/CDA1 family)
LEQKGLSHIDPQSNMTIDQLDDFLDYFLNYDYKFVKPEELLEGLQLDQRYIMITFDDGYFNNLLAIEVLRKYKIPAVFFLTAKNIAENRPFWWDIIYKYRYKQGYSLEKIRKEQDYLKRFKYNYIDDYIIQNFGIKSFEPWSDIDRPLNELEVKSLAKDPFAAIGNHTTNHSILINCSKREIREELIESNKFLTSVTGTFPISIAFPNGYFNQLVLEVAEEVGFRLAFSVVPKKNHLPLENGKLVCISRFMANTNIIKNYGSFYRLGYTPGSLFSDLKKLGNPNLKKK